MMETFPHAIAWALGCRRPAKEKREARLALLERAGLDGSGLTRMDLIDAALCALTAQAAAMGWPLQAYGDAETGWIVLPAGWPANRVQA